MAAIVDDDIKLSYSAGLNKGVQVFNAALICDEDMDAIVVQIRTVVDVDAVDHGIREVVIPHAQRRAASFISTSHDPRLPAIARDSQADLQDSECG